MPYSAKSDDSGTINQFTRRKEVIITTGGTSTPADYQVKLTITYESEMRAGFDDLRFNTLSGGYIDYWIESYTASTTATVWVELPDAITDLCSDIIWMYYGNSSLSDGGVGSDTFIQYHGAASSDFLDSAIVQYSNVAFESKMKATSTPSNIVTGLENQLNVADDAIYVQSVSFHDLKYASSKNEGVGISISEAPSLTVNTYYRAKITNDGTTVRGYFDGNEISTGLIADLPNENMGLFLWTCEGTGEQAWSFARKYIANEPTPSYGTAQHQRRVPQFIG